MSEESSNPSSQNQTSQKLPQIQITELKPFQEQGVKRISELHSKYKGGIITKIMSFDKQLKFKEADLTQTSITNTQSTSTSDQPFQSTSDQPSQSTPNSKKQ